MIKKVYKLSVAERREMGRNITAMRVHRGLSMGELGRRVGRRTNTIIDYERGKISPSILSLYVLAEALQCSVHKLLWEDDEILHRRRVPKVRRHLLENRGKHKAGDAKKRINAGRPR